jgi:hypothetical protein
MSEYKGYYYKITDHGFVHMYSKQKPKLIYRILMRLEKWYWVTLK